MKKSINLEDWEIFKFGEICKFVRGPFGGSLKKSIFKESGFAVYEQKHAIYDRFDNVRYFVDEEKFNEMKRFELNSGDLIMSCSGTIGKIAIVPDNVQRGIINQALLILSPNKKVSNIYLKLWLQSENFQDSLKKYTKGAAIKNVASVKILKNIEIPLPSLPQQKQIVAILDKAFATIDTAKANAEQNLLNAKELFESYLQNVFENKGDDWEEKTLGECGLVQTGTTPKTSEKENYGNYIPFAKPPHFKKNGQIDTKESLLSEIGMGKSRVFPANSVLMVCIGATIGKTGFIETPLASNQQINGLTPNKEYFPRLFYYLFISKYVQKQIISIGKSSQATLPIINKTKWSNINLQFPKSKQQQQQIVDKLDNLSLETKKLEAIYIQKVADLEELKKSVLQKAFSGELNTIN
ncbi:restriction endonuclease subunit S [bacterium]|nr:restriction endonuclease subunit S [bacterium]